MLKVGIVGFGYMGQMHFTNWNKIPDTKVTTIWDFNPSRLANVEKIEGNLEGNDDKIDLTGVALYSDYEKMLAEADIDVISITLPTFLHLEYTEKALNAGLNVLCEKPIALNLAQCDQMTAAAKKANKQLMVAHCIRYWPEYVAAKEIIDSKQYGEVLVATFRRHSQTPTWSFDNWMLDTKRSGGGILDFHMHDVDFVQYLFGMPKSICSHGILGPHKGYGHVITGFNYGKEKLVTAEGGWLYKQGFLFEMAFDIILEKASITYNGNASPTLVINPEAGDPIIPDLVQTDGYFNEIVDFADCLKNDKASNVITLESSRNTIRLIEAEKKSIDTGEKVFLK